MTFVPFHETVVAADAQPRAWLLVLHGVFGSAANWRMFARRLAAERPDWGFLLADLRGHNRSLGAPGPHRLDSMAADLLHLEAPQGEIRGVMGHSLGGKVALAYAAKRGGELDQLWMLDSRPGTRAHCLGDGHA